MVARTAIRFHDGYESPRECLFAMAGPCALRKAEMCARYGAQYQPGAQEQFLTSGLSDSRRSAQNIAQASSHLVMSDRSAGGNICKPRIDRLAHVKFVHHVFPRRVIGKPLYGIASMGLCIQ